MSRLRRGLIGLGLILAGGLIAATMTAAAIGAGVATMEALR